jgi:hypothetical protein
MRQSERGDAAANCANAAGANIPSWSRRLVRRSVDPAICRQHNLIGRVFRKPKQICGD